MAFQVSTVQGPPRFDALPVAKIINYPLEKRDYRPFAQNRLCVGTQALYLRMWAFEVSPMPTSELRCVLYLFPGAPGKSLCISVAVAEENAPQNRVELFLLQDGLELPGSRRNAADWSHPFNGEDLQGVYWGETVTLPFSFLLEQGGAPPKAGDAFPGNFYKLCSHGRFAHQGCFFPADFGGNPYARESMGEFRVVAY